MDKKMIGRIRKTNYSVSRISAKALKKIAKNTTSKPITDDFNLKQILGIASEFEYKKGKLFAKITMYEKMNLKNKIFRWTGFVNKSHKRGRITIVDELELVNVGLINKNRDCYSKK